MLLNKPQILIIIPNKIIDFPCTKTDLISMILSILIFNLLDLIPKKVNIYLKCLYTPYFSKCSIFRL